MSLSDGRKVIAFDFDGVLHEYHGWNEGKLSGPIPGMLHLVTALRGAGAHVVIHTTRDALTVKAWLGHKGFPVMDVYNTKWQRIDVFVDDRAIHFTPDLVRDADAAMNFARRLLDYQPYWRQTEGSSAIPTPSAALPSARQGEGGFAGVPESQQPFAGQPERDQPR